MERGFEHRLRAIIPNVVIHSDASVAVSPCGRFLATCVVVCGTADESAP